MIICQNCGEKVDNSIKNCSNCGTEISELLETEYNLLKTMSEEEKLSFSNKVSSPKKGKNLFFILLLLGSIVLGGLIYALLMLNLL